MRRSYQGVVILSREAATRSRVVSLLAWSAALVMMTACGNRSIATTAQDEDAGSIPECDLYAAKFSACLTASGSDRAATYAGETRNALVSAAKDPAARPGLKADCVAGLKRLTVACN